MRSRKDVRDALITHIQGFVDESKVAIYRAVTAAPPDFSVEKIVQLALNTPCCFIGYGGADPVERAQDDSALIKLVKYHFIIAVTSNQGIDVADNFALKRLDELEANLDGAQLEISGAAVPAFFLIGESPEYASGNKVLYSATYGYYEG